MKRSDSALMLRLQKIASKKMTKESFLLPAVKAGLSLIPRFGAFALKRPVATTLAVASTGLSLPAIARKYKGVDLNEQINKQVDPNLIQNFGMQKMNEFEEAKKNYNDFKKEAGIFNTLGSTLSSGLSGFKKLFTGEGKDIGTQQGLTMLGLASLPTIVFPQVSNIISPSTKVLGETLADTFIPESRRLGLSDLETIEEAKARAKLIGTQNAESLIAERDKALDLLKEREVLSPLRENVLNQLQSEDPVIAKGMKDVKGTRIINDTISTVKLFAPTLTTDKKTMQSILREALTSAEGGLSYQTIKQLADTQKSITESSSSTPIVIS